MRGKEFLFLIIWSWYGILNRKGTCLSETFNTCHTENKIVVCKYVYTMNDLAEGVQSTISDKPTELRLLKLQLLALPPGLLQGTNFSRLRIDDTELLFLSLPGEESNPFEGGNSVTDLTVGRVRYPYNWNWTLLNALTNLSALRIINSDLLFIAPSFNDIGNSSLRVLVIEHSQVRWIEDGAFASSIFLSSFHLIGNSITAFRRSYLPRPANYLSLMNLKGNKLLYLEDDLFSEMPELTYVNLENNDFVTLSENLLSEQQRMKLFVYIAGNPLRCDCSINWLHRRIHNFDLYKVRCFDFQLQEEVFYRDIKWNEMDC